MERGIEQTRSFKDMLLGMDRDCSKIVARCKETRILNYLMTKLFSLSNGLYKSDIKAIGNIVGQYDDGHISLVHEIDRDGPLDNATLIDRERNEGVVVQKEDK
ncbi:hypothetical protein Goshw_003073 [Gossypium schwendimanii]|uniref:Uncharacterized protein n=1 Tax=Gossypium schwendimanii TaxID=34291 RepID=A0A7J9LK20_GOSSC|nr:hypothetical protein [Gossypium schwendimanii]